MYVNVQYMDPNGILSHTFFWILAVFGSEILADPIFRIRSLALRSWIHVGQLDADVGFDPHPHHLGFLNDFLLETRGWARHHLMSQSASEESWWNIWEWLIRWRVGENWESRNAHRVKCKESYKLEIFKLSRMVGCILESENHYIHRNGIHLSVWTSNHFLSLPFVEGFA